MARGLVKRIGPGTSPTFFWLRVWPRGDCWEWRGTRLRSGYGVFRSERGMQDRGQLLAHRYAFELTKGPIPPGMHVDHVCRHPWCVRPSHLVLATPRENVLRGQGASARNARKTHCPRGHEYTAENIGSDTRGGRRCAQCRNAQARAKYQQIPQRKAERGNP